jgi:hypothetical protein
MRMSTNSFSHSCFIRSFDERASKPFTTFGQSCRPMPKIYGYREYPVACEVRNSDTCNVLTFWRSPPTSPSFMKAVVVETLDDGGLLGRRQNGDWGAPLVRNDHLRPRKAEHSSGIAAAMPS